MAVVTVDRIEGEYAVLTDGERQADVPLAWLPEGLREGESLDLGFERAPAREAELRARIAARRAALSADDDGGDFSL